jgi:hypothetical protein
LEALLTILNPHKLLILLQKLDHWLGYFGKAFNEAAIITSQPKKTSDLEDKHWRLPFLNSGNLARINSNSL